MVSGALTAHLDSCSRPNIAPKILDVRGCEASLLFVFIAINGQSPSLGMLLQDRIDDISCDGLVARILYTTKYDIELFGDKIVR